MDNWLDSPGDWLAILTAIALLLGGLVWIIRGQIAQLQKEMVPNGGASMRDSIDRIHQRVDTVMERQGAISFSVERIRAEQEETSRLLAHKIDILAHRMDSVVVKMEDSARLDARES